MPIQTTRPPLVIRGRELLPVVQGGMGVGISAHRLAGAVAREGGMGTIASIDLRHHHADLMADLGRTHDQARLDAANLTALDREVRAALVQAQGRGMVAVNVMKAVASHADLVRQACESGAQAIVMGAGLPLDLPDLTQDFNVALIPILSDSRGVGIVLKRWARKGRLPDAIILEHPGHAGGHLGAAHIEEVDDARFDFRRVLDEVRALMQDMGLTPENVPLIVAGGVHTREQFDELLSWGASGVQVGTAFAVTLEGDAAPAFKEVLASAQPEDIVTFVSDAGLPARAVRTPWLANYLRKEPALQARAAQRGCGKPCSTGLNCLALCGLRDGIAKAGQFCIDLHLAAALKGDLKRGLFFRGSDPLPFGNAIRSVRELLEYFLAREPAPMHS